MSQHSEALLDDGSPDGLLAKDLASVSLTLGLEDYNIQTKSRVVTARTP